MTMVVVSLHTQCLDECGDFGKIWKVVGEDLGEVISACSGPRYGFKKWGKEADVGECCPISSSTTLVPQS